MENVLPKYIRPIAKIDDPENKVTFWDEAIDAFDEKDFKKSVLAVINYINPFLLEGKNIENDVDIVQMQGSAELHVKITEKTFSIQAPFLKITAETNKVALLRKVAEVNFSPLKLAQIRQRNNELWFEYSMPIQLAQPNKVYDIIHNVAVYADDYDDMFISNYKASFFKNPEYVPLTTAEKDQVWAQISDVFDDYKNYTQYFKDKRWDNYIWDMIVISLLKISNMPYVQGKLRSDLIEYVSNLFDSDLNFDFRVDKGVNFMKKLMARSREDIMSNIYHADQFITLRWRSSQQIIADRLKYNKKQVDKYENEERYFSVSYYLQFVFLKLIYDYNLEQYIKDAIYDVLEEVSGMIPDEAAPKLIEVFRALQEGTLQEKIETTPKKKGFFSKLFN